MRVAAGAKTHFGAGGLRAIDFLAEVLVGLALVVAEIPSIIICGKESGFVDLSAVGAARQMGY